MSVSTKFGLSLAALGAIGFGAVMIPACSSSEAAGPQGDGGGGGSGSSSGTSSGSSSGSSEGGSTASYCGTSGAVCCAASGQVPNPECNDATGTCATSTTCSIAASCGTVGTAAAPSCEPLADNTGKTTLDFRMRRIILVAPPKLANETVQNTVVTNGVDMLEPQCGEEGTGLFNWLLSFNTSNNTVTTGGAPQCDTTGSPACDPFTTGYCFVNKNVNGIQVGPVTGTITQASDGTYSTTPGAIPTLNIPIYFAAVPGTAPSIILLPISNGALSGVKISTDLNCIGSVNPDALQADCSDDYQSCAKWLTGGSLTGFITLKTANTVQVSLLNETLCSLLTGDTTGPVIPGTAIKTCAVDANGNPTAKGNYCSTTTPPAPNGCDDSYWLAATFAASAVNINSGAGVPDCEGGGTDGGSPADAASSD